MASVWHQMLTMEQTLASVWYRLLTMEATPRKKVYIYIYRYIMTLGLGLRHVVCSARLFLVIPRVAVWVN